MVAAPSNNSNSDSNNNASSSNNMSKIQYHHHMGLSSDGELNLIASPDQFIQQMNMNLDELTHSISNQPDHTSRRITIRA